MHKAVGDAQAFVHAFLPLVGTAQRRDVVIAPPFPQIAAVAEALRGSPIAWAAQNVHPEEKGAFTGEVSASMLADLGCSYAIVGHSERRALFAESSEFVARKAEALLAHGIRPIVCVGETLEERESQRTFEVVGQQLEESLSKIPDDQADVVVVAYEPVWAIGTGRTATPEIAQEVHGFIRESLGKRFGAAGRAIRIQYGGSVKPDNAAALMQQPDIDGALVGGASLEPDSFAAIVRFDD
jgi:triosephosphate isomerase